MDNVDPSILNQAALQARLERLASRIEDWPQERQDEAAPPGPVPALELVQGAFGLSGFESEVLLFAAGCELSSELARACAAHGGGPGPTFGQCLAVLPDAHWDALTPLRPLRRWRLVEVDEGRSLTRSLLRVPERVLHFLAGVDYLDPQLAAVVVAMPPIVSVPPSHHALAATVVRHLEQASVGAPCAQVVSAGPDEALQLAGDIAEALGVGVLPLDAARLDGYRDDVQGLCRLIERDCLLLPALPVIDCHGAEGVALARLVAEELGIRLLLLAPAPLQCRRSSRTFRIAPPGSTERHALWREALGTASGTSSAEPPAEEVALVACQFPLGPHAIGAAGAQVRERVEEGEPWRGAVSSVCRALAGGRLAELAERIDPRAGWADLVLPDAQRDMLAQVIAHVRVRHRVYDEWGFAARSARGLGVSALFAGESGTGKTLAAEVVAAELGLDLYRIDLSGVVSKYIGETEKNLARVFSAAEDSAAVLLFDEADALFGKRSEVKDSHDRYANIEVSYLLQRMEAYSGLAILTTNQRAALDHAFERRLRFIVHFPFPDAEQREAIWRNTFPPQMPLGDIDFALLAQLRVTGGTIRNIGLNAAFLAAGSGRPLGMAELAQAARAELAKAERPAGEAQIRSWQ